jgi:hypothetical protein
MISKRTYLYEILVRGTPDGRLAGAHVNHLTEIYDGETGEILGMKPDLKPLNIADIAGVLGKDMAGLLIEVEELRSAKATLEAQVAGLMGVVEALQDKPDNLA